jgi:hypothetical protein
MPIKVQCACGKRLVAKDELAGKRTKCPVCGNVLEIPAAGHSGTSPTGSSGDAFPGGQAFPPAAYPGYPTQQPGMAVDPYAGMNPGFGGPGQAAAGDPYGMGAYGAQSFGGASFPGPQQGGAFMQPGAGFGGPPKGRKSGGLSTGAILGIVGLAVGLPCLGVGGCVVYVGVNAVGQARDAARRSQANAMQGPNSPVPYAPTTSFMNQAASAEEQAKNDAQLEEFARLLEEYGTLLATVTDAASLERASQRMQELALQINSKRLEVQLLPIRMSRAENQRVEQKFGARIKAAAERAKREDDRVLRLALQLPFDRSLLGGDDPLAPPGFDSGGLPPTPTGASPPGAPGFGPPGGIAPGTGVPPGTGGPRTGVPGAGVPGPGVPGPGVPGPGVPGAGRPGAGTGIPGTGVPTGVPGTGLPGGAPGTGPRPPGIPTGAP